MSSGNSVKQKLLSIGFGGFISFAITRTLKGRVSLSAENTLKINLIFALISACIEVFKIIPQKLLTATKEKKVQKKSLATTSTKTVYQAKDLAPKVPPIRIPAGKTTCLDYSKDSKGAKSTITLQGNVYEIVEEDGCSALLMCYSDFKILKEIAHTRAFGSFNKGYIKINIVDLSKYGLQSSHIVEGEKYYVILSKVPSDLMQIQSYIPDKITPYKDWGVEAYALLSDMKVKQSYKGNAPLLEELMKKTGKKNPLKPFKFNEYIYRCSSIEG